MKRFFILSLFVVLNFNAIMAFDSLVPLLDFENKPGIELAVDIAREIKAKIKEHLNLTASAGVSYNKFLAKIASDQRKPDGLCTIHPSRAQDFIDALRIEKFWLVGPKTAQAMHRMGIFTGADLRAVSLKHLTDVFGKMGPVFYNFARGIDERPVVVDYERKSMGCEHIFGSCARTASVKLTMCSLSATSVGFVRLVTDLLPEAESHFLTSSPFPSKSVASAGPNRTDPFVPRR